MLSLWEVRSESQSPALSRLHGSSILPTLWDLSRAPHAGEKSLPLKWNRPSPASCKTSCPLLATSLQPLAMPEQVRSRANTSWWVLWSLKKEGEAVPTWGGRCVSLQQFFCSWWFCTNLKTHFTHSHPWESAEGCPRGDQSCCTVLREHVVYFHPWPHLQSSSQVPIWSQNTPISTSGNKGFSLGSEGSKSDEHSGSHPL